MTERQEYVETVLGELAVWVRRPDSPNPTAMVMWPSLLMDHTLWSAQAEHFADRFTTVTIDPPGHGRSSPLTRTFSFVECATALRQVLDALDLPKAHVLGNSWGAMIGGTFTALHPDRVGCAVLMNGTASPAPLRQRLEYGALLAAARVLRGIRPPLTRSVLKAFLGPTSLHERPDVVRHVLDVAQANNVRSASYAIRSVVPLRPDQTELFATIRTPVLVIAGREDATFPVPELERMAAAIPTAELQIIEGAAHLVALEVPDQVNKIIDDFLVERA
ncbi:alpha/beta hydrolase [Nocardioides sp.]|uniref:alpha/beta fold hydrolase n=1 Tax=Nocardioides sp. TaxID=35761 RepID=UPI0031FF21D4